MRFPHTCGGEPGAMMTTPPTNWTPFDPSLADNMGDYVRNNLDFLKDRQEDLMSSVNELNTFKAQISGVNQSSKLHYAVIGIDSAVSLTLTNKKTLMLWHSKVKLTFTPLTDLVLFRVQLTMEFDGSLDDQKWKFGLHKDSADVSIADTDSISGTVGSDPVLASVELSSRNEPYFIAYEAPLPMTRNVAVSISPTVGHSEPSHRRGRSVSLVNPSKVILMALDVGLYS